MWEDYAALAVSFVALGLVVASYFFKEKRLYLCFQALGIFGVAVSYLFTKEFFAMIGTGISCARTVTYFCYEQKDKKAPLWVTFLFLALAVASYFIVNFAILQTAKPYDLIYLTSLTLYGFIFRVRNMKFVRFAMLLPLALSVLYNCIASSTIFVILSYAFEFCASVVAIFKYHILPKRSTTNEAN